MRFGKYGMILLAALLCAAAMTACGEKTESMPEETAAETQTAPPEEVTTAPETEPSEEDLYRAAQLLAEDGDFAAAAERFDALGDYQDSAAQAAVCRQEITYAEATAKMEAGEFEEARTLFLTLREANPETDEKLQEAEALYQALVDGTLTEDEDLDRLFELLDEIELMELEDAGYTGFRDSEEKLLLCQREITYADAGKLAEGGSYLEASRKYESLQDFRDSERRAAECRTAHWKSVVEQEKDITEKIEAILTLAETDAASAADYAKQMIRTFDVSDRHWYNYYGIGDLAAFLLDEGYDCTGELTERAMATRPLHDQEYEYVEDSSYGNMGFACTSSEKLMSTLFPSLIRAGFFRYPVAGSRTGAEDTFTLYMVVENYLARMHGIDEKLHAVRVVRQIMDEAGLDYDFPVLGRAQAAGGDTYSDSLVSTYSSLPELSGSTARAVPGKYIFVSKDLNRTDKETCSIHYEMMLSLPLEYLPDSQDEITHIIVMTNEWKPGQVFSDSTRSVQTYSVNSLVAVYAADGKKMASLSSANAWANTVILVREGQTAYYCPPDTWRIVRTVRSEWFGKGLS